ncbi:MAG: hypothetical protein Q4G10_05545 [Bacteroidia bacterium]|nr:hypothetical protein [Bacteroidia bacterium]
MKKIVYLIFAIAAMTLVSCSKNDDVQNASKAPIMPPVESLRMDLPSLQSTKGSVEDAAVELFKAIYNEFVNIFLEINESIVRVPLEGFEMVAQAQPTENGGVWTWSVSDTNIIGQRYNVSLAGEEITGDKVLWNLSVSKDGLGGFQNYTWIDGWSELDGSAGQWQVRVSPDCTDVLVTSDWTASGGQLQSCRVTYNLEHAVGSVGQFFNGSYIEYLNSATDEHYKESLKIQYFQIGHIGVDLNLEWNEFTGACRIKFGHSGWAPVSE